MDLAQAKAARLQAQENGESKYSGMACGNCGGEVRYTNGGGCAKCIKSRSKANPELNKMYHEVWRNNNREYLRAYYKVQRMRAKEQASC